MTRKHYELIATVLRDARLRVRYFSDVRTREQMQLNLDSVVSDMAKMLAEDNPRFNAEKFERACSIGHIP